MEMKSESVSSRRELERRFGVNPVLKLYLKVVKESLSFIKKIPILETETSGVPKLNSASVSGTEDV